MPTRKYTKPKTRKPRSKSAPYNRYSDDDKAVALLALQMNNNNIKRTAKELGIPLPTLWQWSHGYFLHPQVLEIKNGQKRPLADRLEEFAHLILGKFSTEAKINKAPLKDAILSLAIVVDKMRLLLGQPTNIQGKTDLTNDDIVERLRGLAEQYRRALPPPTERSESGSQPTNQQTLSQPTKRDL